jgi:hypothetical protein
VNDGKNGNSDVVLHMKKTFSHKKADSWGYANTQLAHVGASIEVKYESSAVVNKFTTTGKLETFWEGSWTKEKIESTEDFVRSHVIVTKMCL